MGWGNDRASNRMFPPFLKEERKGGKHGGRVSSKWRGCGTGASRGAFYNGWKMGAARAPPGIAKDEAGNVAGGRLRGREVRGGGRLDAFGWLIAGGKGGRQALGSLWGEFLWCLENQGIAVVCRYEVEPGRGQDGEERGDDGAERDGRVWRIGGESGRFPNGNNRSAWGFDWVHAMVEGDGRKRATGSKRNRCAEGQAVCWTPLGGPDDVRGEADGGSGGRLLDTQNGKGI